MRRTLSPSLALLAGLVTLLSGCAGESPTSPSSGPGGGTGGTCAVSISLAATSVAPLAGSAVVVRATVTKNGAPVPDGQSVFFTVDYGFFAETGLQNASKVVISGVADITVASQNAGTAHIKATYDCGSQQITVQFASVPDTGPFVSSIAPNSGTCAGGDTVTINGGRFTLNGNTQDKTRVSFGGLPATITSFSDTAIVVKTPAKTLANPQVPEQVDVTVQLNAGTAGLLGVTVSKGFTYFCVDKRIFISSILPNTGTPDGGDTVAVNGGNFGTNIATTRVTFGGVAATITAMTDTLITVLTPRHILANAAVPETVDVAVTKDLGLVSQQSAALTQAFTYRASGSGLCPPSASLFVSSLSPIIGSPNGGDPVTINGGGFGTTASSVRVDFGGVPAQVLSVTNTSISVSTPRRTLANPTVPETVNVVVTADIGGAHCASATFPNAFTYASAPVINSISPVTGPNDVSTRVTIFGSGFQFPMQVFLSGGGCGSQKIEAAVINVTSTTVVFQTPIAANGNACLANSLVSVNVINPQTGAQDPGGKSTLADAFKYYACPTVSNASPQFGPYAQTTTVTINGQNFGEPVDAEFVPAGGQAGPIRLVVSSVSAGAIVVQMPPIDPLNSATGGAVCSNVTGSINISFPSLSCGAALQVPFTYKVDPPQITNAAPTQFSQEGCTVGTPAGCTFPLTVTVTGSFFADPMTVVLLKDGTPLSYTQVNNPVVSNPSTLTFLAPAIRNGDMNVQACTPSGGSTTIGTKWVPTSFGIRVTNKRTGCSADLPNILIYNPLDPSCRLAAAITVPNPVPAATICSPYTVALSGVGTGTLTWSMAPPAGYSGLALSATTGATTSITGTPKLSPAGAGTASGTISVTVTLTDSAVPTPNTASATVAIPFTDPGAPFTITGSGTATISGTTGGTSAPYAYTPAVGPATPVAWSGSVTPAVTTGAITVTAGGAINVAAGTTPTGTYTVTVTGTDNGCGHKASLPVTLTVN